MVPARHGQTEDVLTTRECTVCPEWVIGCVHWDGVTLYLGDDSFWKVCRGLCGIAALRRFQVTAFRGAANYCPWGCGAPGFYEYQVLSSRGFNDLAAAWAAFRASERELLGRPL